MRSLCIAAAVLCIAGAAVAQQTEDARGTEATTAPLRAEFQRLAEVWRRAYNSKDASNFIPLYAPDAEYISAHVDGYVAHGRDAVIRNFQNGMNSGGYVDSISVVSAIVSCDLASVVSRYSALAGGMRVEGRNLLVCRNIGGTWLIVTHMTVVRG